MFSCFRESQETHFFKVFFQNFVGLKYHDRESDIPIFLQNAKLIPWAMLDKASILKNFENVLFNMDD